MLNSTDIHSVKFAKSLSGYKVEEVDIFLDKIEADYIQNERLISDYQAKIESLNKEIAELKSSQESINNVLMKSQQLADKIVSEAKEKSEEILRNAEANISAITQKEKELSSEFELKAKESKLTLEKEMEQIVLNAKAKADSITAAANDSVERQQMLFDKLKMEIAAFKTTITAKYKEHLEILSTIPDTVPTDPKRIAEIVSTTIDRGPEPEKFIKLENEIEDIPQMEEEEDSEQGFVIGDNLDNSEEE